MIAGLAVSTACLLAGCREASSDAASRRPSSEATARCVRLEPGRVEVVVAPKANGAVRFAAGEMTNFLSRVLGAPVPLVRHPAARDRVSVILGTNGWSAAAGVDVANLKRDGFVTAAKGREIFIAGRDDDGFEPFKGEYDKEIATLYGVYDFLEKYAGCRFYFPGELGEIVPRKASLEVPEGTVRSEPDWKIRKMSHDFGAWFDGRPTSFENDRLFRYRLRHATRNIPCCHGLGAANFSVRFGKEHPEYFQLKNGKRMNEWMDDKPMYYHSMLCHTSGVWDEAYKDAVSYFRGEGPEVRGRVHGSNRKKFRCFWGWNVAGRKYFDVMPQDGMSKCECPNCQAAYAKAKDPNCWADELIWGNTVRLANRLKADGFKDCYLTQMAYWPYNNVPDIDIPDNVLVMVCSNGAWTRPERQERDIARFTAWNRKRNGNIWIWNNTGKHPCSRLDITDFPTATPHAFGAFYKRVAPLVFGAFCFNESEKFLYSAINYYVFAKVAWENETDVEALLDEYYRLMFGKAEKPMRAFFETVEEKWMKEALGSTIQTPLGEFALAPSECESWSRIYTSESVRALGKLFEEAAAAVPAESLEAKRIAVMKREFYDPLVRRTEPYSPVAGERELARRAREKPVSVVRGFRPVTLDVKEGMRSGDGVFSRSFPLAVKPGKTYRVSYFLTCEGVKPRAAKTVEDYRKAFQYGGVQCAVQTPGMKKKELASVGTGLAGDHARLFQSFEVRMPDEIPARVRPQVVCRMFLMTGKAVFEDLVVEEVK